MIRSLRLIIFIFLLCTSVLRAGDVELALDLNRIGPGKSANPKNLLAAGSVLFFSADDGIHGTELWKSSGAPQTTSMLFDLQPGPRSSNPQLLEVIDNVLYFTALRQNQLQLLKVTYPQLKLEKIAGFAHAERIPYMTVSGSSVFFSLCENQHGCELWIADQFSGSARLVKDIQRGGESSYPSYLNPVNGKVVFVAQDPSHGSEVWGSDGTEAGTILLQDLAPGADSSFPLDFQAFGNNLIFSANDRSQYGWELWITDGTPAGTRLLSDLVPGPDSSDPIFLTPVGNQLAFVASDKNFTEHLFVLNSALQIQMLPGNYHDLDRPVVVGDRIYFVAESAQIWVSDLTPQGTRLIDPNPMSQYAAILGQVGGKVVYAAGRVLKVTNGTQSGTKLLSAASLDIEETASTDTGVYFTGGDVFYDLDLFVTDGNSPQVGLARIHLDNGSSDPRDLSVADGQLYFIGTNGSQRGVWQTSGNRSARLVFPSDDVESLNVSGGHLFINTSQTLYLFDKRRGVQQLTPSKVSGVGPPRPLGNKVIFAAATLSNRNQLWISNGTAAGTRLLKTLANPQEYAFPTFRATLNNLLFFTIASGSLWRTDGTTAGTFPLTDPGPDLFQQFYGAAGKIYMISNVPGHSEIWTSDGTRAGTYRITTIQEVGDAALVYPDFYFTTRDFTSGQELWKYSIASESVNMVTPLQPGTQPGSNYLVSIFPFGEFLFFESGGKLWRTDGTSSGTIPLQALFNAFRMMTAGNQLYFVASTTASGNELWVTDGTPSGTHPVFDLYRGPYSSNPSDPVFFNHALYFAATASGYGRELFRVPQNH